MDQEKKLVPHHAKDEDAEVAAPPPAKDDGLKKKDDDSNAIQDQRSDEQVQKETSQHEQDDDESSSAAGEISIDFSVEPLPTTSDHSRRVGTSLAPGAYHTNANSTDIRAVGKTPLSVLGAGLRMANKPGQDFATTPTSSTHSSSTSTTTTRRQQQEQEHESTNTSSDVSPTSQEPVPPPPAPAAAATNTTDDELEAQLHNLTVASPVVEELLKDLQQAQEYDPEAASVRSRGSWKSGNSSLYSNGDASSTSTRANRNKSTPIQYCQAAMLVLILVVVITLSLVFTLAAKDTTTDSTTTKDSTSVPPTLFPTALPTSLDSNILSLLPTSTRQRIDGDVTSPQGQAFQWILNDPNLESQSYTPQRIIQRFALATIFYSSGGYGWYNSSQWLSYSTHECQWYTRSSFAMKEQLQYVYPGYLTEIPNHHNNKCNDGGILRHLWLDSNHLVGMLPPELYLLTSLQTLSMGINPEFGGTIGTQVGLLTNLEGLAMYYCPHGGTIPSQIGLLTNLKALGLNNNGFQGTIPLDHYQKLTHLQTAIFARNQLTGTIPTIISSLSQLKWFTIDENDMEGTIPSEIGLVSSLEWFVVGANRLYGTLPTELALLPKMLMMSLYRNQFSGTLPTELGLMTTMTLLSFRANQFTGTIPSQYGLLQNMTLALNFQDNPTLVGTIPSQLGLLTNLQELSFLNNNHNGQIPSQLGHLTKLVRLTFGNNTLSGSIPNELSSLAPSLYTMNLKGNTLLSGTVPDPFCNINATCRGGSLNPCEGLNGLLMDCSNKLCGCDCSCASQDDDDDDEEQEQDSPSGTTATLVIIPPQD